MKIVLTILLVLTFGVLQAQQAKIVAGDKVDYDKMSEQELAKTDQELSRNMDVILGFGLKIKVVKVEEEVKSASELSKEKNALRFQIGVKLPKFIKTDPPDKVFKIGWDFGVVK